jgi:hypothetical protein
MCICHYALSPLLPSNRLSRLLLALRLPSGRRGGRRRRQGAGDLAHCICKAQARVKPARQRDSVCRFLMALVAAPAPLTSSLENMKAISATALWTRAGPIVMSIFPELRMPLSQRQQIGALGLLYHVIGYSLCRCTHRSLCRFSFQPTLILLCNPLRIASIRPVITVHLARPPVKPGSLKRSGVFVFHLHPPLCICVLVAAFAKHHQIAQALLLETLIGEVMHLKGGTPFAYAALLATVTGSRKRLLP